MNIKDWIGVIASSLAIVGTAGATGKWAADQYYWTKDDARASEKRQLDREITYIEVKIQQQEATNSELIYVETLKQQLRALEQQ